MEQLVARWAHNPKVVGSSPAPATFIQLKACSLKKLQVFFYVFWDIYETRSMNIYLKYELEIFKYLSMVDVSATKRGKLHTSKFQAG